MSKKTVIFIMCRTRVGKKIKIITVLNFVETSFNNDELI